MGCIPYESVDDAHRCLRHTVIMYRGRPVYVTNVTGPDGFSSPSDIRLYYRELPFEETHPEVRVNLDDPDIDISGMRLGYANSAQDTTWLERYCRQGLTQGLSDANVMARPVTFNPERSTPTFGRLMDGRSITDMFAGNYPTIQNIVARFESEQNFRSAAFHRCFAMSKDGLRGDYIVYYKGTECAFGNLKSGEVTIAKAFGHLKEQLEELGLKTQGVS